ncbi:hypothetical protein [Legionella rowbothamii]|uniref:hypothetical protein n=1 Tax=Legionella rowbothamii TaxID=96229 RepID=UPI001055D92C|nr:hypothetical protein [Legionella rowbothamii]
MSKNRHISSETEIKLHFEHMGKGSEKKPLVFQVQNVRMDFIQYCINQGPQLKSPETELNNYLNRASHASTQTSANPPSVGDLNRQKLSALFAHLSAFNYQMEGLVIEPVAVADLIKKMREINNMSDDEAAAYLDKLLGGKIPGQLDMRMDEFLLYVGGMYQEQGVNFHCYLRENFFQPLKPEAVKTSGPALNYFMPDVFHQQHINTCELSSVMTVLKKVATNFDQMQEWCMANNEVMPETVLQSREKINALEQQFEQFLNNPDAFKEKDIKKLTQEYRKELEKIQVHMEQALGKEMNPEIVPYLKKHANHTLATIHHFITARVMPDGFDVEDYKLKDALKPHQTPFQAKVLGDHLNIIVEKDIVKNLHKDNDNPEEKKGFLDNIKQMFLYGKSRAFTEFVVCGHALLMDICNNGILKVIEHRNSKDESTILSKNGLRDIGIQSPSGNGPSALKETVDSIEQKLKVLYMERDNIVKIKAGIPSESSMFEEMNTLLAKKDDEIRDLLEVEKNVKVKYGLEKHVSPESSFKNHREAFKQMKEEHQIKQPKKEVELEPVAMTAPPSLS